MSHKSRYLWFVYIIVFFSLLISFSTHATANNVEDCFKEGVDCEQFNEVPSEKTDDSKETNIDIDQSDDMFNIDEANDGPSLFSSFLKMAFALLLVLGLIYVMLKFVNRRQQLFQQTQTLENLGGISVGQNKSIQVVRVGSKMYLIGVGDNVQLLKEIEDADVKETITNKQINEPVSLKQWFKSLFPKQQKNEQTAKSNSFNHLLAEELDKMTNNRQQMIDQLEKRKDTHE